MNVAMTPARWTWLPALAASLLSAIACGRAPEQRPASEAKPAAAAEAHADADSDPNSVHVDPGMLRDLRITTKAVESRSGGEQAMLLGELAVDERAYAQVGVPVAARVTRLLVTAGDTVRAGQALAELTSPELGRARAEYVSAAARVRLAEATLSRRRELAAERIAPAREVQEAEHEAAAAQASLRSARAAVSAFGVPAPADDLDADTASTFVLRTPVGGVVIERAAIIGQMLAPETPAFRVANLSTLWLTVHAFERDAVRIERGRIARLTFAALPGQDFEGRVAGVGREVERESRTIPVRIDVSNRDGMLRPGMSATAAVAVGSAGAPILSVPVAAVQRVRDAWCVFLPKDARTFEIRRIGRGRDLGTEVEVLFGLRPGETVVVDGAFLLKAQAEKGEADHDAH
jgi:membrane fusion protein, heavy metal efflux system